ncbi:MAG: ABC transporter ATP-binding protein [Planctomycetota bacterium]|nr:ABC transporter ATP-binding protein [Planctomycetota bacterium]MEE3181126.1 ABC transporter ATP-binding protein [Planctomycetota bacterium]
MSTVLAINQLGKSFPSAAGEVHAVRDVSLEVAAGELVTLRGPSGCGKSTLLMAAGGLLEPTSGSVEINGTDLYSLGQDGRAQFRAENIGFVFQQFHLIPYLDVRDNILAASLATARAEDERVDELLEIFGLQQRAHHVPAALSTGEKQRTAMARALLNNPKLILADEPTGNLDQDNAEALLEQLSGFSGKGGAVLLVTHDARVDDHAGRTIEISDGNLVS